MKAACASACLALVVQPVQLLEYIANEDGKESGRMSDRTGLLVIDIQKGSFTLGHPIENELELLRNIVLVMRDINAWATKR